MSTATVTLERRGQIAWLRLNRPEALNAFDHQMDAEMLAAAGQLARRPIRARRDPVRAPDRPSPPASM